MATIEETLDKAIEVAVKRAILKAHPVGSLYLSLTSDNPADLLGGGGMDESRLRAVLVGSRFLAFCRE